MTGSEKYTWLEKGGVFVPDQVEGSFRDRQFKISSEDVAKLTPEQLTPENLGAIYQDATRLRDVRFHWFSINSPSNDNLFDFKHIDDPKAFVALCDPQHVGAPELDNLVK